jgi:hypothetical protein
VQTLVINKDILDKAGHINNAHIMEAVHILTDRSTGNLKVSAHIKLSSYATNQAFSDGKARASATDVLMTDLQAHPDYQTALSVFVGGVLQTLGAGAVLNMVDIPQPAPPVTYEEDEEDEEDD